MTLKSVSILGCQRNPGSNEIFPSNAVECAGAAGFIKTFTLAALTNSMDVITDLSSMSS